MKLLTKQTLKIFWQHTKQYKLPLTISVVGLFAAAGFDIYKPILYKNFFDALTTANQTELTTLYSIIYKILAVSAGGWLAWRIGNLAINKYESHVMTDLLTTCFNYLHDHAVQFFGDNFAGSLVRKINRYSRAFEDIADQIFFNIGQTILRIVIIAVVIYTRSHLLFAFVATWAVAYSIFTYFFLRYKIPYDQQKAAKDSETTGFLADTISNNINIKLFTNKKLESNSLQTLTSKLTHLRQFSWNLGNLADGIQSGLMITLEIFVMFFAIKLWQQNQLTVGDFVLLQSYMLQIFDRMWSLSRNLHRIFEAIADADEMTEILITPHQIQNHTDATKLKIARGHIQFQKVSFYYDNQKSILNNLNLDIKAGEKIALVGPSGGGKSTIVKLLFRFYDINKGQITIDDQNIAHVTQDSLRHHISLVPQEPILFHRTLLENIRYAKPNASNAEVIKAAKLAHCHEFISQFPEKYNTYVGERGVKLSGGERQRVAIARAILKNAPILVLDEATSSLDSESERYIQDALKTLMKDKTAIVIAHRLSTIMQMDRIVVINNGKIVEQGSHEQLLELKDGRYQQLWHIQAGSFN